jgi:hypothetical protein
VRNLRSGGFPVHGILEAASTSREHSSDRKTLSEIHQVTARDDSLRNRADQAIEFRGWLKTILEQNTNLRGTHGGYYIGIWWWSEASGFSLFEKLTYQVQVEGLERWVCAGFQSTNVANSSHD